MGPVRARLGRDTRRGRIYIELPLEARCVTQKAVTYLRRRGVAASGIVRDA